MDVSPRRIAALRQLIDRPGTEAEGEIARAMMNAIVIKYEIRVPAPFISQDELRTRFPKGSLVYYNFWAYAPNTEAIVVGYPRMERWLRVQFFHLKTVRAVPIYTDNGGFHLSTEPRSTADAYDLIHIDDPQWRRRVVEFIEFIGAGDISTERRQAMIDHFRHIPGCEDILRTLGMVSGLLVEG